MIYVKPSWSRLSENKENHPKFDPHNLKLEGTATAERSPKTRVHHRTRQSVVFI